MLRDYQSRADAGTLTEEEKLAPPKKGDWKRHKGAMPRWRKDIHRFWAGHNIYYTKVQYAQHLQAAEPIQAQPDDAVTLHPNMPAVVILLTPFAYLPVGWDGFWFAILKAGIIVASLFGAVAVCNHRDKRMADWVVALGMAFGGLLLISDLQHGNINVLVLGAIVLHAWLYRRGRDVWAGASLALAGFDGTQNASLDPIAPGATRTVRFSIDGLSGSRLLDGNSGFTWSHASIMENVLRRLDGVSRLVQVGVRDLSEDEHDAIHASRGRIRTLFDDDWATARLGGADLRTVVRKQLAYLPREVYVSCDIDGLEPALCPNTGTPVPGGLSWSEVRLWLDELVRSGRRVVGMDLVEVNPGPEAGGPASDSEDSWDAVVGARLLYRMISAALSTR